MSVDEQIAAIVRAEVRAALRDELEALRAAATPGTADAGLSPRDAAKVLGVSVGKLEALRARGDGPAFSRVGRRIIYRRAELLRWLDAQTAAR